MTAAKSAVPHDLKIPDVGELSPKDAALAYADAGLFVLPVASGKHPGSIVGKGWPDKSTTDAEQIQDWWDEKPDAGIAIHTGASGLAFFDLDTDAIPEELAWLRTGIVQFSRAESVGSERGHYGFFTGDEIFTSGDLKLSDGTKVGEIRSGNTVVIASPSDHVHANTKGGHYRWRATDVATPIPKLPSEARRYLRLLGTKKSSNDRTTAMAGWCVEATDDVVRDSISQWQSESRRKSLNALVKWIENADAATRNQTRDALRIAACEARIGFYPLADAVEKLRQAMIASYRQRDELDRFDDGEFWRLVRNGVGYAMTRDVDEISAEATRDYGDKAAQSEPIFREFGPTEWAKDVAPTRFLVKRVLSTDTWGVNSGPKKSLKTHDNQAIGLAVATGTNLYNDARFAVERPGKVLYIIGEGGDNQIRRTLHRMLAAYGINRDDVARDPDFPFVLQFGAAPLNDPRLRSELNRLLDQHQPSLVLMESFYNFHPASVTASNLYERGQVIDEYHKLVRAGGSEVVSLLTDHHKKGASGTDLDQISMSGQAENADSWIIRDHRKTPDVQVGDFWLTTSFNSRDWGGNTFDVDWHLGPFDHDAGAHVGQISWNVHDRLSASASVNNAMTKSQRKELDVVLAIQKVLTVAHDQNVRSINQTDLVEKVKQIVPDAGKDFIIKKLDAGEQEGSLIAQPGQRNAKFYILTTHPMYAHD